MSWAMAPFSSVRRVHVWDDTPPTPWWSLKLALVDSTARSRGPEERDRSGLWTESYFSLFLGDVCNPFFFPTWFCSVFYGFFGSQSHATRSGTEAVSLRFREGRFGVKDLGSTTGSFFYLRPHGALAEKAWAVGFSRGQVFGSWNGLKKIWKLSFPGSFPSLERCCFMFCQCFSSNKLEVPWLSEVISRFSLDSWWNLERPRCRSYLRALWVSLRYCSPKARRLWAPFGTPSGSWVGNMGLTGNEAMLLLDLIGPRY